MSLPNAALQKLLQEVEIQALQSQQKIQQTQAEINTRKRDARMNQLTLSELSSLSKDTNVYEGVGKMSVKRGIYSFQARFVAVPIATLNQRLDKESTAQKKEISELEKKLHYQETTFKNSRQHIEKILQTRGRA